MAIQTVPCCFHPFTVTLVDDDSRFLDSLSLKLARHYRSLSFRNPYQALERLNAYQPDFFTARSLLQPEENRAEHPLIDIDLRAISREIYRPQRFSQLGVVVLDYAMPGLDGLALAEQLDNRYFKTILLTGEADEKKAIGAFNGQIIQRYIRKHANNFVGNLLIAIRELEQQIFLDLSTVITTGLHSRIPHEDESASPPVASVLTDRVFAQFFLAFRTAHQITEYYLLDNQGSFLLLKTNGTPSWFILKNEIEMKNLHDFAVDEEAPQAVIKALQTRSAVPYFHTEDELQTPPADWERFLHPAQLLEGRQKYYYAHIDAKQAPKHWLMRENIVSYQQYLQGV